MACALAAWPPQKNVGTAPYPKELRSAVAAGGPAPIFDTPDGVRGGARVIGVERRDERWGLIAQGGFFLPERFAHRDRVRRRDMETHIANDDGTPGRAD